MEINGLFDAAIASKKSKKVIKVMNKNSENLELLAAGLAALGQIGDEDSQNEIAHYFYHPEFSIRLAACKAGLAMDKEYLRTNVRHVWDLEQDPVQKQIILDAFNEAN